MTGMGRKNKIIVEYNLHISAAQRGQVAPVDTPASTRHKLTWQITLGSSSYCHGRAGIIYLVADAGMYVTGR